MGFKEKMPLAALACLALISLLSLHVAAYPLTGGNGNGENATVYGIIKGPAEGNIGSIYIDILEMKPPKTCYKLALVDEDDTFYQASPTPRDCVQDNPSNALGGSQDDVGVSEIRKIYRFSIPEGAVIKRLRVEPMHSDSSPNNPFSIDWTGIPEVSGDNITMRLYGSNKSDSDKASFYMGLKPVYWEFNLKITNTASENLLLKGEDFILQDQYGWNYPASGNDETTLLPGESMKSKISVFDVSPLSRPVHLKYKNLKMDVSSWT